MLCIDNTSTDVYFNLATEEYLLKNHAEDIFMLWQNDNAIVLGKHQNAEAEIDLNFAADKKIRIARRYSGGGTVYHDRGNINLTFIENTNRINFDKYIRQTLDFLSFAGIQAEADERLGITTHGLKISGSAQSVYKNRVMYHCTLLYSSDLDILISSLKGNTEAADKTNNPKRAYTVKSVKSKVTNICDHLQEAPDISKFRKFILDYFLKRIPENRIYNFSPDDIKAIEKLRNGKYALPEWIFN